jgi:hypothetical protein
MEIDELSQKIWSVELSQSSAWECSRYPEIPIEIKRFLCSFSKVEMNDSKGWLNSADDFSSVEDRALPFNFIEVMSLESADDEDWKNEIEEFWDVNLPIFISVRDGYEYVAYNLQQGTFVYGAEPEFEDTSIVADSISGLINYLNDKTT